MHWPPNAIVGMDVGKAESGSGRGFGVVRCITHVANVTLLLWCTVPQPCREVNDRLRTFCPQQQQHTQAGYGPHG